MSQTQDQGGGIDEKLVPAGLLGSNPLISAPFSPECFRMFSYPRFSRQIDPELGCTRMNHFRRAGREYRRNQCLYQLSARRLASVTPFQLIRGNRVAWLPAHSWFALLQPFEKPTDVSLVEMTAKP